MSTNDPSPPSTKNKDLHNRLMLLEKFIELKSNECAYYRSKVHLMQMSSFPSKTQKKTSIKHERSSSEETNHSYMTNPSQSDSVDSKQRRSSVPVFSQPKSILKKKSLDDPYLSNSSMPFDRPTKSKHLPFKPPTSRRRSNKIYAHNQNYYEEDHPHQKASTNSSSPLLAIDKHLLDQLLISYANKDLQPGMTNNKTIQCNDQDFHPIKTSSKRPSTVLMIRLPRRFVKSLIEQQKNPTSPKLKVHLSSELLNKLFQSIDLNSIKTHHRPANQFTIQSQFGQIAACVSHEDSIDCQESKTVHAKAEVKSHHHHRERLPRVRHLAPTRSDGSDRKKRVAERNLPATSHKHRHYRRKKRHLHKANTTSEEEEEISSKRSSLTNVTQSDDTPQALSAQTDSSVSVKKNKRN